jgi:putative superfamily III holin-X
MEEERTKTQNLAEDAKDLKDHVSDFLETYVQLTAVKLTEKFINIASTVVNFTALAYLLFLFFFFIGFGLAWWVGSLVNSRAGGFFIVAGFYLICVIFLATAGKKTVIPLLRNLITRLMYD